MCFDYIHCSYPHLHLLVLFFLPESSLPTWIVDPGFCEWQKLSLVIFPHLLYCVYCNVLQFYPFFSKQQDFGFFFLTNKFVIVSDALMKGWKGLHVAFLFVCFLFTIFLEISKNPKWETADLLLRPLLAMLMPCLLLSWNGNGLCWIMPVASWRSFVLLQTGPAWINYVTKKAWLTSG